VCSKLKCPFNKTSKSPNNTESFLFLTYEGLLFCHPKFILFLEGTKENKILCAKFRSLIFLHHALYKSELESFKESKYMSMLLLSSTFRKWREVWLASSSWRNGEAFLKILLSLGMFGSKGSDQHTLKY